MDPRRCNPIGRLVPSPEMRLLERQALEAVEATTGFPPARVEPREKTFETCSGKRFYLRTYAGRTPDWFFGVKKEFWNPDEYFVLVCNGRPSNFVIPINDLLPLERRFPLDRGGNRKLRVDRPQGEWALINPYPPLPIRKYLEAFHLLS